MTAASLLALGSQALFGAIPKINLQPTDRYLYELSTFLLEPNVRFSLKTQGKYPHFFSEALVKFQPNDSQAKNQPSDALAINPPSDIQTNNPQAENQPWTIDERNVLVERRQNHVSFLDMQIDESYLNLIKSDDDIVAGYINTVRSFSNITYDRSFKIDVSERKFQRFYLRNASGNW